MTRSVSVAVLIAVLAVLAPSAAAAPGSHGSVNSELAAVRAATAKYHNVERALADGYAAAPDCVSSPDGGMGYHYFNQALFMSPTLDPRQPEVLLYAPLPNGGRRLVGVEYLYAYGPTAPGPNASVPTMFGHRFDGPMPGHFPGMPWHSEQHAWLWQANPKNGMFAPFNPNVRC